VGNIIADKKKLLEKIGRVKYNIFNKLNLKCRGEK